ncbi:MAG: MFS transporter [Peptococcaceae bacterium]|nr:MFS transporter [Peptococcaceae bacterium]
MKKIHYAWWIMIACCAITSCTGFVSTAGGNFYRPVAEELGVGIGTLTLYVSIMSLTMAALFSTAGKFLAKNMKPVLLLGGILQYVPFGLMSCFTSVYHFYVAGFFIGVGASITMFMAVPILINMWFVEKKGLALGISLGFSGVSGAIASMVAGVAIPAFGWRIAYIIVAAIGLVIFVPAILFLVATPQQKGVLPYGYQAIDNTDTEGSQEILVEDKQLSPAKVKMALICMMFCSAVLAASSAEATQVSAFSTGHFGLSVTVAATMMSCFTIGGMIGKVALGAIDDHLGHTATFLLGIGLVILSQIMLLIAKGSTLLIMAAVLLAGIALAVYGVLPPLMTSAIFGQRDYNKYWAYIMSAGCIAGAVATPTYGTIFDTTGSYTLAFVLIIVFAAIGGIMGIAALRIGSEK